MAKKKLRYKEFRLCDRTGTIKGDILVVADSFEAYKVLYLDRDYSTNIGKRVVDGTIVATHVASDFEASRKENTIYYRQQTSPELLASLIQTLRDTATRVGATPEAIRLLDVMLPFSEKEKKIMAEKLKAKASAAKPDKDGLKSAAKKAPVAKGGGNKGTAKRGNAEALAKARAARSSGPDTRKITKLKKAKDIEARDGTFRQRMLQDLLASNTVQDFRDKDKAYDAGCLRYAQEAGYISLPAK